MGGRGAAWLTERLIPQRYSKPEVQISLSNSFNQTVNALSIPISPQEVREIEAKAEPVREKVRRMLEAYRLSQNNDGRRFSKISSLTPTSL
jgi:hypothetical protein